MQRAFVERVRRSLEKTDARRIDLSILRPYGVAYAVRIEVDRPAWFLLHRLVPLLDRADAAPASYSGAVRLTDGSYVEVVDRNGRPAARVYRSTRHGGGGTWIPRRFAGCDPFVHIGGLGDQLHPPPRCPAM